MRRFFVSLIFVAAYADAIIVRSSGGLLEGYTSYDAGLSRPVHVFKAVPFAKPPTGDLRFALPEDPLPWDGVLNAMEYSPACMSNSSRTKSPQENISEDCLYLNIFADKRCFGDRNESCPVITYIHGGSFTYDSAVMFNDTQIVQKYASHEIIFVIPAFRLGVLGFFNIGNDDVVPRNIGMYDMIKALKWIKEEIRAFGGDADRITLMGNSAGASSVAYLMMSPEVPDDYFHQAISLSNAPDLETVSGQRITNLMIESAGCNGTNWTEQQIVDCMKRKPAEELISWQRELEDEKVQAFDGPAKNSPLFPGTYASLLRNGKAKPMIVGVTKYEFAEPKEDVVNYRKKFCTFYCHFFEYYSDEANDECVRFYLNETGMYSGEYSVEAEAIHAINYRDAVTWHSKGAPIYLDSFQMPNRSTHANDMFFALGLHYSDHLTEGEKFMDQYYPQVLRNFVKTGRPDEEWEPLKDDGSGYFSIEAIRNGSDIILPHQKNTYFYQEQIHFWLSHLSSVNERAIERQNRTERSVLSNSFLLPLVTNQLPLETNSEVAALKEANESLLSAFWVVVVIALVLASALLVMAISNHLNRRMQNSYYFAEETEIFGNSGKAGVVLYGSIN